jgi:catechol 2,3-dioxygenase-like lactoylglutathione lyase family enzyme
MLNHVALEVDNKEKAERFFTEVLDLPKVKTFVLEKRLNKDIFGKDDEIDVNNYGNENIMFEVFIAGNEKKKSYNHVCINVEDKAKFIEKCKKYRIETNIVKKGDRELLFIKDYFGNMYEIK